MAAADGFAIPAPKKPSSVPLSELNKPSDPSEVGVLSKSKYQEPEWAAEQPPSLDENNKWRLEILKNGVPIGFIDLSSKPRYVLGRQGDGMCDAVLEHPSISRQHAVMQHHKEGTLWMVDLASTHGTHINKRKILPNAFEQIRPGDVIKFGDSQRLYLVHGPEEMRPVEEESANLAQLREKLNQRRQREEDRKNAKSADARALAEVMRARQGDVESNGISWGLSADEVQDEEAEQEEENLPDYLKNGKGKQKVEHTISLGNEERSKKDEELWQKLQAKIQKQNNLEEENRRILSKEGGMVGLSDGQRRQVNRNEERLASLAEEVAELEERIRGKNLQRGESRKNMNKKHGDRDNNNDDDDDDFYDRTKSASQENRRKRGAKQSRLQKIASNKPSSSTSSSTNLPSALVGKTLTEELLSCELEKNNKRIEEINQSLTSSQKETQEEEDNEKKDEDELVAFMKANESVTAQQQREVMMKELAVLQAQQVTLKALLKVAAPALGGLSVKSTATVPTATSPVKKDSEITEEKDIKTAETNMKDTNQQNDQEGKTQDEGRTMKDDEVLKTVIKGDTTNHKRPSSNQEKEAQEEHNQSIPKDNEEEKSTKRRKIGAPVTPIPSPSSSSSSSSSPSSSSTTSSSSSSTSSSSSSSTTTSSSTIPTSDLAKVQPKKQRAPLGPTMKPPPDGEVVEEKVMPKPTVTSQKNNKKNKNNKGNDDNKLPESLEGGDLNWCPPQGQTGDGKTHLNERFGY